jgi:intein/homing endonuclease
MDAFEQVFFAGLEPDQRNILWVRHSHAGHHELHFVIPRVELASGNSFNATPEHADLHNARFIRWGATPGKDERAEAKEAIHAFLKTKLEANLVHNRVDVLAALQEVGLEINRAGKDYITVKDPESGEKLRLKGGIYAEQWQSHLNSLTERIKAKTEQDTQEIETLTRQQFENLSRSLSESSKNALSTTESIILKNISALEQTIISRCQVLSWAFSKKCLCKPAC